MNPFSYASQQIAKALCAFLAAAGTWGATALADDSVSSIEWVGLTGAFVAFFAVFALPNRPDGAPDPESSEQHVVPGDH